MKTYITVRSQFLATHSWPDCSHKDVEFLRSEHHHQFQVALSVEVGHPDRQVEFIQLKRKLDIECQGFADIGTLGSSSCEHLALAIFRAFAAMEFNVYSVVVSEDGIFDATVITEE
jgi:hypothetical protein